jgi:hypothetical protein
VQVSGGVVAEFADVTGAESPLLAGDDGSGDLASGESSGGANFNFGSAVGIARDGDKGVGGVETYADEIDSSYSFFCLRQFCHLG